MSNQPSIQGSIPEDIELDGCWMSQHTRFLCQTRAREPDLLLIGDSLIKMMQYSTAYKTHLEPLHSLNFGIIGDRASHVLWRVQNGELDGIAPRAVILHVGTDSIGASAEQIVEGILHLVSEISSRQQSSTIILLGMLPCGRDDNPRRKKHESINEMLSAASSTTIYSNHKTKLVVPDWESMIQPDGTVSHRDLYDYVHPTDQGYCKVIEQLLEEVYASLPNSTTDLKITMSGLSLKSDAGLASSDAASAGGDSS